MMRKSLLLAACLVLALGGTPALAAGNVNFSLGNRSFNDNEFEPVDEQTFMGVFADFGMETWPVDLSAGLYRSTEQDSVSGFDVEATITELSFGAMKTWTFLGNMHPFAGAGLSLVKVEAEADTPLGHVSEDDTGTAVYAEGGVYWRMGSRFNLGTHARFNRGSTHGLDQSDVDSDYFQIGIIAGFGWPAK